MTTVLVVDDEKNIRNHLASHLRELGYEVETATDGVEALAAITDKTFDVVLSDIRMPGMDGMALLAGVRARSPDSAVVLMTAYATVPQAVEAMREGAYEYLVKPFSLEEVEVVLSRIEELRALRLENLRLRQAIDTPLYLESETPTMREALAAARRAAESDITILLTGESGTGKSLLARQIHAWSNRRAGPFVTVACTTLAEQLLESELFGHVEGAFTGAWKDSTGRLEAAARGTLFLDEVGDLALSVQGKLLRFLEERRFERVGSSTTIEVDTRILAATSLDLEAEISAGRFRPDLFFRLNVVAVRLPALRERPDDTVALVDHILGVLSAKHARSAIELTAGARDALRRYHWPGNVREMTNALEKAIVLARTDVIDVSDLPDHLSAPQASVDVPSAAGSLEDIERRHIAQVLSESSTLEEAAARLGINVTTLWRKRKRYGIN